jgi:hypothetical protein
MKFQYFEIRPCVNFGDHIDSYMGEREYVATIGDEVYTPEGAEREAEAARAAAGITAPVFWTIYGRDEEGLAMAVGDFATYTGAEEIMNAILAPMAAVRDVLYAECDRFQHNGTAHGTVRRAACDLDDFINQCSNSDRL